ncbi:response regulator [Amphritea opalescens]|uniref:histidine kinase n=1 Tax=Amphritea opalescens TaxID=2490544 RepID=A0A430KTA9_9GAMM|nr:ATP-binding protein [Amphritea opalescens]RTE66739.1 response regulator [Amphritea opalescens]
MIDNKYFKYGIRQQVLLITLIPLVLMTLVLAGYFISTRVDDNKTALIERGETMSRLLAQASEFGLISGLTHQLEALSQGPTQEDDVADVIFSDTTGEILYRAETFTLHLDLKMQPSHHLGDDIWLFTTPVTTQGIVIGDSPETKSTQAEQELLGWVTVAMSTKPMHQRESFIVTNSLLILLGGLIGTFIIAARFAERLAKPVINLTSVVKKLEEGQLDARVDTQSYAELGLLENGINLLAEQVQSSKLVLESQVEKATAQLRQTMHNLEVQNSALEFARQHADQANRAKDNFLARMSHELRTPLTSILGFTNMLRQTDLSFEQLEHCRIINQTSTMLLSIIDDILDFAKLQSDAITLEQVSFNPELVIFEALEMQSQSAAAKGLELAYQIDEAAYEDVLGDPTRLRQIATNLISNAIKFTDSGQILVFLQVIEEDAENKKMRLCIRDTGIGITDEQQTLLFNAFAQADSSITRRFGGSGLGLVIVQKLVELMQGQVELNSQWGKGTQVCCDFMVKVNPQPSLEQTIQSAQNEVIIFDRHPESLTSLCDIARPLTAKVHACATLQSLEKTLAQVQEQSSALIFGLSANPDIANQQKLKIAGLFSSFKGNILLLMPALTGNVSEYTQLGNFPHLTIKSKPLHRTALKRWLGCAITNSDQQQPSSNTQSLLAETTAVIAEDNDFNRLLLRKILESAGATVIEASNGQQALSRIHEVQPDIVIMDVHMPVMDGIEATREARKSFPQLPIVALTADVITSEEQALRQAGVSQIEYKPINDSRLLKLLANLCRENKPLDMNNFDEEPAETTNLIKYKLSKEDLHEELSTQINSLHQAFSRTDLKGIRDHSHQLTGLAGLCELPELENCSIELNEAAKAGGLREIWQVLWRLERLITHQQY